jgi:hypothetical protein
MGLRAGEGIRTPDVQLGKLYPATCRKAPNLLCHQQFSDFSDFRKASHDSSSRCKKMQKFCIPRAECRRMQNLTTYVISKKILMKNGTARAARPPLPFIDLGDQPCPPDSRDPNSAYILAEFCCPLAGPTCGDTSGNSGHDGPDDHESGHNSGSGQSTHSPRKEMNVEHRPSYLLRILVMVAPIASSRGRHVGPLSSLFIQIRLSVWLTGSVYHDFRSPERARCQPK